MDEGVLSCIFAYMKKASEDGLDGMVSIFQVLLSLLAVPWHGCWATVGNSAFPKACLSQPS